MKRAYWLAGRGGFVEHLAEEFVGHGEGLTVRGRQERWGAGGLGDIVEHFVGDDVNGMVQANVSTGAAHPQFYGACFQNPTLCAVIEHAKGVGVHSNGNGCRW